MSATRAINGPSKRHFAACLVSASCSLEEARPLSACARTFLVLGICGAEYASAPLCFSHSTSRIRIGLSESLLPTRRAAPRHMKDRTVLTHLCPPAPLSYQRPRIKPNQQSKNVQAARKREREIRDLKKRDIGRVRSHVEYEPSSHQIIQSTYTLLLLDTAATNQRYIFTKSTREAAPAEQSADPTKHTTWLDWKVSAALSRKQSKKVGHS